LRREPAHVAARGAALPTLTTPAALPRRAAHASAAGVTAGAAHRRTNAACGGGARSAAPREAAHRPTDPLKHASPYYPSLAHRTSVALFEWEGEGERRLDLELAERKDDQAIWPIFGGDDKKQWGDGRAAPMTAAFTPAFPMFYLTR
jgi:hypothetical protein